MNETKYKDIVGEWCGKHHTQKELEAVNKGKGALAKYFAKAVNMYMLYFCFVVVVFCYQMDNFEVKKLIYFGMFE